MGNFFLYSITTACLIAVFTPTLRADVVDDWTAAAMEQNPGLLKSRAELRAALARVPQAGALPDPGVEFETMGADGVGSSQRVLLGQAFPWPGTLGQRESVASLQARAYWHEVQAMELAIAARIRTIAAEIAYLQRESQLVQENRDLYTKQEAFLEQASRGGGAVSELVRVEMESGLLDDDHARIGESIARQQAELEALVGRPVTSAEIARVTVQNQPSAPAPLERLIARLETANPLLQAMEARIRAAEAGVRLARLETYPDFMLQGGYRRVNAAAMRGGSDWQNEAVVMFSVSIPIWGGKNEGKREEATAMLEQAQAEREEMALMLRAELRTLLSRSRDAARRAGLFEGQLLPKARQALETVEASYRSDQASLLDLFEARRQLLDTETNYWRAVTTQHIVNAELDALFGLDLAKAIP